MKVLTIFGTRPEAIKMAPLALRLAEDSRLESKVCVTAQHRQMLDLRKPSLSLSQLTGHPCTRVEKALQPCRPDPV